MSTNIEEKQLKSHPLPFFSGLFAFTSFLFAFKPTEPKYFQKAETFSTIVYQILTVSIFLNFVPIPFIFSIKNSQNQGRN